MIRVLFVCTGNICRSPMAEGLFRELVRDRPTIAVASAGIGANTGQKPSTYAIEVMDALDIDIRDLRSKPLTSRLVEESDFIFVMTYGHLDSMLLLFPSASEKTFLLREPEGGGSVTNREVADPIGQDRDIYEICRNQIREALPRLLSMLPLESSTSDLPALTWPLTLELGADSTSKKLNLIVRRFLHHHHFTFHDNGIGSQHSARRRAWIRHILEKIHATASGRALFLTEPNSTLWKELKKEGGLWLSSLEKSNSLLREHAKTARILCLDSLTILPHQVADILLPWLQAPTHSTSSQPSKKKTPLKSTSPFSSSNSSLAKTDPSIFEAIEKEKQRQQTHIELIASENFTSPAVMEAQGSCLTNKYAEGYPQKRWYGGCEHVDTIEKLAIARAKTLFQADHANVQPHSGSQANAAVYFSVLEPGDKILTMDLSHGGHLTHGHPMNFSGRFYKVMHYGVTKDKEVIDYDALEAKAKDFQPKMITVGASAYSRIIDFPRMRQIADSVGAYLFADMAHIAGLVATELHPSPVPYADFTTTTTHKTLRGPRGGLILCQKQHAKAIDSMVFPGIQGGPLMHVIAAKAVCFREALEKSFQTYQRQVLSNAKALCEGMKKNGYRIVSGTTENHVMLVDLQPKKITGKEAQEALDQAGITVNKNALPFDTESPFRAGGIRLGSPAVTTRGMKEDEMFDIANFIHEVLENRNDTEIIQSVRQKVITMTSSFPLP